MPVPYTFGSATSAIPLSNLDSNFATPITLGNTSIQLGNVVTTLNNMTLANVTVSSGSVTLTSVNATNATISSLTSGRVPYASTGGLIVDSANMTFNGTRLTVADLADAGLTSGRVTYATTGGSLTDSANLTFDGTNLTLGGGTANGVGYLNASKVLTTGSALTFDGSQLDIPAGTAATPSLSTPADPDTGLFFPTANQLAASVGGSEGMRLTSTGLGIGTSSVTSNFSASRFVQLASTSGRTAYETIVLDGTNNHRIAMFADNAGFVGFDTGSSSANYSGMSFRIEGSERMLLNRSGNLGLGVTPSAWGGSGAKAFEIGTWSGLSDGGAYGTVLTFNGRYNSGWFYKATNAAAKYEQDGAHRWYTAPSGTAGNAITFTQAMTLDASGDLTLPGSFRLGNGNQTVSAANTNDLQLNASSGSGNILFRVAGSERARIDSSGNLLVGTTSGGRLTAKSADASSSSYGLFITDSSSNLMLGTRNDGYLRSPIVYSATSAAAANITVDASGYIYRSTSALKYKTDIRDLEPVNLDSLRPVRYKSLCGNDDKDRDFIGFVADEAADNGWEELVSRNAVGEIEGFQYERVTALLWKKAQEQQAIIEQLKADVAALKKGN